MNTRMVVVGSCLLLSSLVACGGDDSGGGGMTDAGTDASEPHGGSGGKGGSGGSGGVNEEGGSGGSAAGSGGHGGAGGASSEMQYAVSGDVSGLSGSGLVLKLNGGDDLSITKNGSFSFASKLAADASYAVTVGTQPTNPVQACSVAAGSGKIGMADVSNVKVTCSNTTRSIGGTLTGSGNATVVLKNGSEMLSLSADGDFTFPTAINQGADYAVTVQTPPTGRSCSVAHGSGTTGTSNVTDVAVSCYADLKLLAKARVGGASLSWETNGATSYNVYVSTDASCNWDNPSSCTGADHKDGVTTPYLWSGLTDGTPYYFQVRGMHPNDFVTRSAATGVRPNRAQLNGVVNSLVVDNGTAYIGGTFSSIGAYTGTTVPVDAQTGLTTRIPNFPIVSATTYVAIPDGQGGYFIGGEFTSIGTADRARLAHVKADGSVDENWNPNPNGYISVLALSGTTLFVGGSFTTIGGQSHTRLAAISTTGTGTPVAWDPAPDGLVTALVATSDTLYVGGEFSNISTTARSRMAAYPLTNNMPGALKTDFHPDPDGIRILAMYLGNGKLYVSGYFLNIAGTASTPNVAAFDAATGAHIPGFAPAPDFQVNAFALLNGKLYAGGRFSSIGGQNLTRLAALDPDTGAAVADWNPAPDAEVMTLAAAGDRVFVGGKFSNIGNAQRRGLAAVSTSGAGTASAWNPQPDGDIGYVTLSGDTLYVLGETLSYGAEPRNKLASFSGATLTNWAPNVTGGDVRALAFVNSTVYAGGTFTKVGGSDRVSAAAIDGNGGPTAWNAQINSGGQVFALASDGTHMFVGGSFTAAGGGNRANLAGLTLDTGVASSDWTAPAPDGAVRALATGSNNGTAKLFVGGEFQNLGTTARPRIAALQSTGALQTDWNPGANMPVNAILVVKGADVYIGGEFTQLGGSTRNHIGSVDFGNGALQGWDPSIDGNVIGLGFGNNTVFAIGDFGNVGPSAMPTGTMISRNYLAGFDATARTLQTAYPNLNDVGRAVAADANYLYLGGDFTGVKGLLCSRYFRDGL